MVDVEQHERRLGTVAVRVSELSGEALEEVGAVEAPGQRIPDARLVELAEDSFLMLVDHRKAEAYARSELDRRTIRELGALDSRAVHVGAVAALQIFDEIRLALAEDARVRAADAFVVYDQGAGRMPSDPDAGVARRGDLTGVCFVHPHEHRAIARDRLRDDDASEVDRRERAFVEPPRRDRAARERRRSGGQAAGRRAHRASAPPAGIVTYLSPGTGGPASRRSTPGASRSRARRGSRVPRRSPRLRPRRASPCPCRARPWSG